VNINLEKWLNQIFILIVLNAVSVAEANNNIADLIQQAEDMQLSSELAWLDLLHYKNHVFGGNYSQADDDAFFVSNNGKYDANAELIATLRGFFESRVKGHAQCLFPARLFWLNSKLHFRKSLPQVECPRLKQWTEKLDAQKVTLLFPSMYLNNPGSMFGHTFLRLDSNNKPSLLNYTLSYAAEYDPSDNGFVYIINGLSGGYPGVFSVQPYYETVQEYGDVEHRDIWEYSLDLNQKEVDQLVRHTWEVTGIKFDYYFFRENCSYRLLSLLDVAKPGLNMTRSSHPVYAIPVDTVRTVDQASLITNELYRPAKNSRIEKMFSQITKDAQKVVFDFIGNNKLINLDSFTNKEQAQIYELAHEINQSNKNNEYDDHQLLLARSKIELKADEKTFQFKAVRPEKSHASAKGFVAYGEKEKNNFVELGFRPAFHDLLDSDKGFVKGTGISVLDARLRWYEHQQRFKLEELTLFNMTSLSPVKKWTTPLSWQLDFSIGRHQLNDAIDTKILSAKGGAGYSFEWANIIYYMLVDAGIGFSKKLNDNYEFYMGVESGALFLFDNSRMKITVSGSDSVTGNEGRKESYSWLYQLDLNKNNALRLDAGLKKQDEFREQEIAVKYIRYF